MNAVAPQTSSDQEKLEALRQLDLFRSWRSLDEERRCLCCGCIINGRTIQIVGGTPETGDLRAICPTENCVATPLDWAMPQP